MTAHAFLSASGAKRWLECPPSAMLEKKFPPENSEYAAEGSFAHALAELRLGRYLGTIKSRGATGFFKRKAEMETNEFYSKELEEYVDAYYTYACELIGQAQAKTSDAVILLEQKLDFSQWVPGGFGTGDLVIVADGTLEIVDLKYGKGVAVSAENNPQMALYALGALAKFDMLYDIERVRMTIHQPRLDSISTVDRHPEELLGWAEEYLKPRAEMAVKGEGEYSAGEHCRFCKARFTCRARAEANLDLAKMDFKEPGLLTDEEIGEVLTMADGLKAWAADIAFYALDQAENHGKKWTGWKLVEGRSNRKYTDKDEVAKTLIAAGYTDELIYEPKEVLGITAMTKEIGRNKFDQLLSGLIIKPAGKPTLVPESDKRPEIGTADAAKIDFLD